MRHQLDLEMSETAVLVDSHVIRDAQGECCQRGSGTLDGTLDLVSSRTGTAGIPLEKQVIRNQER